MTQYDKSDAADETESTPAEVSEAWHDARDDAAEEGGWGVPENRHGQDDSDDTGSSSNDDSGEGSSGK